MSLDIPSFHPIVPKKDPLVKDLVGIANDFSNEFILNINNERIFKSMGTNPNKVYLLEGEPGTGKTMAINALNNSLNSYLVERRDEWLREGFETSDIDTEQELLSIADAYFLEYSIGQHGTAYINMGSRIVNSFFEQAYMYSLQAPTVVVLDEADALIGSRTSSIQSHSEDRKILETIMKNLQTLHDTDNMFAILMTNIADQCDIASLRAGRVDKRIRFEKPNYEERRIAYKSFMGQISERAKYPLFGARNYGRLAELSEGFNYADIRYSIEGAVKSKAVELIKSKKEVIDSIPRIKISDLEKAILSHKKSFQLEDKGSIGFR